VEVPQEGELSLGSVSNFIANPGENKKLSVDVSNSGTGFLNACELESSGLYASWISTEEEQGLAAGEETSFDFEVSVPSDVVGGEYSLAISVNCQEQTKSVQFVVEILEQELDFEIVSVERVSDGEVKVVYFLEELSDTDQEVELQFLLFSGDDKVAEMEETKTVSGGESAQFETIIAVDSSLSGELSLLINMNSETYSSFVQEDVMLGAPISGFLIFDDMDTTDGVISLVLVVLFLGFTFFIVRRILHHKKKAKSKRRKKE